MSDMNKPNEQNNVSSGETLSLNDDRRVKTLSPGALVTKRFFRNRLAVLGLVMLAVMFLFSFVGYVKRQICNAVRSIYNVLIGNSNDIAVHGNSIEILPFLCQPIVYILIFNGDLCLQSV